MEGPDYVSLQGPVELEGEQFVLRIPMEAGGAELANAARGIGRIDGSDLVVSIPVWLTQKLGISEGSLVIVDNRDGKLNITRSSSGLQ